MIFYPEIVGSRPMDYAYSDKTLDCCGRAREFSDGRSQFGIAYAGGGPDREPSERGWYLIYDSWYLFERIGFCPFCGKRVEESEASG